MNETSTMKRRIKLSPNDLPSAKKTHWATGLLVSMEDPHLKVREDDKVVVIRDKYPKADYHYLVLPKENIPSLWHVKKGNEKLLQHMVKVAEGIKKEHKDSEFLIGYHAVPSMQRLHLHVVSTDFSAVGMKTKYHWNSFTTPFFLHSKDIMKELHEKGELKKMHSELSAEYLSTPLKCHKCHEMPEHMPELKKHLLTHFPSTKLIHRSLEEIVD